MSGTEHGQVWRIVLNQSIRERKVKSLTKRGSAQPFIQVCDAIMGSGKTEAAITYINEHPEKKFIYIAPYIEEANRIKESCPDARFVEPSNKIPDLSFRKLNHIASLIKRGKNIASTHAAFRMYSNEMLDDIRRKDYVLIVDEAIEVLDDMVIDDMDVRMLRNSGYIRIENGKYTAEGCEKYNGILSPLIQKLTTAEAISIPGNKGITFFWTIPTKFFRSFRNVFILTYMAEGSQIGCYLDANHLGYTLIGVHRDADGTYRFGKYQEYIPAYVKTLSGKIHILDDAKLNGVGDDYHALSATWYKGGKDHTDRIRKNLYNIYHNRWKKDGKLWSVYAEQRQEVTGPGYGRSFLSFNARAKNAYRDRKYLAYPVNVFPNTYQVHLFQRLGTTLDQDKFALSTMLQWIWRSAIRDGGDIYLYLPSSRMRKLLTDWIEIVGKGGGDSVRETKVKSAENAVTETSFVPPKMHQTIAGITTR